MHKTYLMLIGAMTLAKTLSAQNCANEANVFPFSYNGKNYEIVKEMKSWADAASCATERGGYLAELNDQDEQDAVYNAISAAGIPVNYTSVTDGGGVAYMWIGATDQATEGTWLWDGNNDSAGINFWNGQGQAGAGNGMAAGGNYNNWGKSNGTGATQEPDNFNNSQHAAAIALAGWPYGTTLLGAAGQWNDINMGNALYYIIEKNTASGIRGNTLQAVHLYPNPVADQLTVTLPDNAGDTAFRLTGLQGKTLISGKLTPGANNMDMRSLPNGLYYLWITDGTRNSMFKVVKQ